MGNYLHRTTKQFLQSVSPNELPEPLENYIDDPNLSAVSGIPSMYWIITGDVVTEMSQAQKDAVDATILSDERDARVAAEIDDLESVMRQIVKMIVRENNILRDLHGLSPRTITQVRSDVRSDLGA